MTAFNLNAGQQQAVDAYAQFLADPTEQFFVLKGPAGTGKTYTTRAMLHATTDILRGYELLDPDFPEYDIAVTATTNKATEVIGTATGYPAKTIFSFFHLRVEQNYQTGESSLVSKGATPHEYTIIFVDEASYITLELLALLKVLGINCKFVLIGDPYQLIPFNQTHAVAFSQGFPEVELTEIMRQDKNPITNLVWLFREVVRTGEFFSFEPDGTYVAHLPREAFNQAVCDEFLRPDWGHNDSKIVAWTNKKVQVYNQQLRELAKGSPTFSVGDYAICNSYFRSDKASIRTDQTVRVTAINPGECQYTASPGYHVCLDNRVNAFLPEDWQLRASAEKQLRAKEHYTGLKYIDKTWIDLRAAYACTTDKSQGSTYKKVFIDLDDIGKCRRPSQLARMLYVGSSRAKEQVIYTGDIR